MLGLKLVYLRFKIFFELCDGAKSKFGQILHEIRRIRRKFWRSQKYFSQKRSLGGLKRYLIVGNRVANFRKNGVGGPPTIRYRRVWEIAEII